MVAKTQTIRTKVRSLACVPSEASITHLLGQPDGITMATPDIEGIAYTRCYVYKGPQVRRIQWRRQYPFLKVIRYNEQVLIHIFGKDRLDRLDRVNTELAWGPTQYNRAVVVLEHELSPYSERHRALQTLERLRKRRKDILDAGGESASIDRQIEYTECILRLPPR